MRLNDPHDPDSLSYRMRARRDIFLRSFLLASGRRILDVGGTTAYWRRVGLPFLAEHGFTVTLVNIEAGELGEGPFESITGDATSLHFADMSFDIVHSNSVIEHVGDDRRMAAFASEVRRLAPAYYIQTPNRHFPIDPHFPALPFFQFLPETLRIMLLRSLPIAHSGRLREIEMARTVSRNTRLLSPARMRAFFPDSEMWFERYLGLRKSIIVTRGPGTHG